MALRNIREIGDPVLTKISKPVKEITPRTREMVEDMFETLYDENGVGLAAAQVGVLKRIFIADVTGSDPHAFINPVILETSGEQTGHEGCLSVPGKTGIVTRPNYVRIGAYDLDMNYFELEGTELLARCICHEYDHLDGHLYVDKVEGRLIDLNAVSDEDEDEEDDLSADEEKAE